MLYKVSLISGSILNVKGHFFEKKTYGQIINQQKVIYIYMYFYDNLCPLLRNMSWNDPLKSYKL